MASLEAEKAAVAETWESEEANDIKNKVGEVKKHRPDHMRPFKPEQGFRLRPKIINRKFPAQIRVFKRSFKGVSHKVC